MGKCFLDYVDDSAIGLKAWPSGQAGRGVACWRVADRSALREGPGSRELWCHWIGYQWSVNLNAFPKPNRCRWMLKDHHSTRAPRLTSRQHRAPLTASCRVIQRFPNSQSDASGDVGWFGSAGARNSPETDQPLRQPVKSGGNPHDYPCHQAAFTDASAREPGIGTDSIVPAGPKHPASPDARRVLLA